MKKINFKKLAKEWFEKAREDLGVARLVFEEKSYSGSICFHCHQSAEKYLKGFLAGTPYTRHRFCNIIKSIWVIQNTTFASVAKSRSRF